MTVLPNRPITQNYNVFAPSLDPSSPSISPSPHFSSLPLPPSCSLLFPPSSRSFSLSLPAIFPPLSPSLLPPLLPPSLHSSSLSPSSPIPTFSSSLLIFPPPSSVLPHTLLPPSRFPQLVRLAGPGINEKFSYRFSKNLRKIFPDYQLMEIFFKIFKNLGKIFTDFQWKFFLENL